MLAHIAETSRLVVVGDSEQVSQQSCGVFVSFEMLILSIELTFQLPPILKATYPEALENTVASSLALLEDNPGRSTQAITSSIILLKQCFWAVL